MFLLGIMSGEWRVTEKRSLHCFGHNIRADKCSYFHFFKHKVATLERGCRLFSEVTERSFDIRFLEKTRFNRAVTRLNLIGACATALAKNFFAFPSIFLVSTHDPVGLLRK